MSARAKRPAEARCEDFLVPDLGEGLEDATITSWSVAVGDDVELNQTLCTVETNKAEVEIPSPYRRPDHRAGRRRGRDAECRSVLVRIATAADTGTEGSQKPVLVGYGADDEMDDQQTERTPGVDTSACQAAGTKAGRELNVDLNELAGSGADGVITREDVLPSADRSAPVLTWWRCAVCTRRWRIECRCRAADT